MAVDIEKLIFSELLELLLSPVKLFCLSFKIFLYEIFCSGNFLIDELWVDGE